MSQIFGRKKRIGKRLETISLAVAACVFGIGTGFAHADAGPVKSSLSAYEVALTEDGIERLAPATSIEPGGVIEYRLAYENTSDAPLKGFTINGNVPAASAYMNNSDQLDMNAIFEARTVDLDWSVPPLIRMVPDAAGTLRPEQVPATEYTALRWRVVEPVQPGAAIQASYRVRIDR